jgi:hypothetical protein
MTSSLYRRGEDTELVLEEVFRHTTGLLFLGHSEMLPTTAHPLRHVGPTVYARS